MAERAAFALALGDGPSRPTEQADEGLRASMQHRDPSRDLDRDLAAERRLRTRLDVVIVTMSIVAVLFAIVWLNPWRG